MSPGALRSSAAFAVSHAFVKYELCRPPGNATSAYTWKSEKRGAIARTAGCCVIARKSAVAPS